MSLAARFPVGLESGGLTTGRLDDSPSNAHEQHLNAARHVARTLDALISVLGRFEPTMIYDQSGVVLEALARRVGREFSSSYPFQFFDYSDKQGEHLLAVNVHSHLARSIRAGDYISITGLGEPFRVKAGDYIYLECQVEENIVKGATLRHGDKWEGYPQVIKYAGAFPKLVQQKFFVEIGYVVSAQDDFEYDPPGLVLGTGRNALVAVQCVRNHLIVTQTCDQSNRTVQYVAPWFGVHMPRW